ncbi:antibiotic biosynthesis monooxygenase [bacterium]|nr:antibiotic biosynthesis monooxygenase [bacterium]
MFVACNYLACVDEYQERLESLLRSRSHSIDNAPGFMGMKVLKPIRHADHFLIVSQWYDQDHFDDWRESPAFQLVHARGFGDLKRFADRGEQSPVRSTFRTYNLIGV